MSQLTLVSPRRLSLYYAFFGVAGLLATQVRDGNSHSSSLHGLLPAALLINALICAGYLYVAWRLPSMLADRSPLPSLAIASSVAMGVVVCLCRATVYMGENKVDALLPLAINLGYNWTLWRMVSQAATPAPQGRPAL